MKDRDLNVGQRAFSSCHPPATRKTEGRMTQKCAPMSCLSALLLVVFFPPEHRILAAKGLFLMGLSLWGTAIAFGVMGSWEGVGTCENRLVVHPGLLAGRGMPR